MEKFVVGAVPACSAASLGYICKNSCTHTSSTSVPRSGISVCSDERPTAWRTALAKLPRRPLQELGRPFAAPVRATILVPYKKRNGILPTTHPPRADRLADPRRARSDDLRRPFECAASGREACTVRAAGPARRTS